MILASNPPWLRGFPWWSVPPRSTDFKVARTEMIKRLSSRMYCTSAQAKSCPTVSDIPMLIVSPAFHRCRTSFLLICCSHMCVVHQIPVLSAESHKFFQLTSWKKNISPCFSRHVCWEHINPESTPGFPLIENPDFLWMIDMSWVHKEPLLFWWVVNALFFSKNIYIKNHDSGLNSRLNHVKSPIDHNQPIVEYLFGTKELSAPAAPSARRARCGGRAGCPNPGLWPDFSWVVILYHGYIYIYIYIHTYIHTYIHIHIPYIYIRGD